MEERRKEARFDVLLEELAAVRWRSPPTSLCHKHFSPGTNDPDPVSAVEQQDMS